MQIVGTFNMTKGEWMIPHMEHDTKADGWLGFYFEEFIMDWSILPRGAKGKLYFESQHADIPGTPPVKEGGEVRLAYQYEPWHMIPVPDSNVKTYQKFGARWQMYESNWFDMPTTPGLACVWMEGKPYPDRNITLALITLVVAIDIPEEMLNKKIFVPETPESKPTIFEPVPTTFG
jgi:hypothetical protein